MSDDEKIGARTPEACSHAWVLDSKCQECGFEQPRWQPKWPCFWCSAPATRVAIHRGGTMPACELQHEDEVRTNDDDHQEARIMTAPRWRVGTSVGRTLYFDDRFVGHVDTPEMARAIVEAMNGRQTLASVDHLTCPVACSLECDLINREDGWQRTDSALPSKTAAAWIATLPLSDNIDAHDCAELARDLDGMFERVRREEREACIAELIAAWNESPDRQDGLADAVAILRGRCAETACQHPDIRWVNGRRCCADCGAHLTPIDEAEETARQRRESPTASPQYPGPLTMTRDEIVERVCDMLYRVWETFDPNAHEPNDCFCARANPHLTFQSSSQALRWVEEVVTSALRTANPRVKL